MSLVSYSLSLYLKLAIFCTLLLLTTYYALLNSIQTQHILSLNKTPNSLYIIDKYYLDLTPYPIEQYILKLFSPNFNIKDVLRKLTILNIYDKKNNHYHLINSYPFIHSDTFACNNQLLPLPILHHLIKQYLAIENTNDFFDTPIPNHPFIVLPFINQPVLKPGYKVCVRIVLPFQPTEDKLFYRPYPDNHIQLSSPWWDTFMTSLTHIETNATTPIYLQPWSGHGTLRQHVLKDLQGPNWAISRQEQLFERNLTHIYEADIILPDQQGTYELSSLLEFRGAKYNLEQGPPSPYQLEKVAFLYDTNQFLNNTSQSDKPASLPLCQGLIERPGRWLPHDGSDTIVNRHGKYWAPYDCRYRHISYQEFNTCLTEKYSRGINLFGDSNTRRSIKKFLSFGNWCKNWENNNKFQINAKYQSPQEFQFLHVNQTRQCFCEDYNEYGWNVSWFDPTSRINTFTLDNVTVNSYKWDGLSYLNDPSWEVAFEKMPTKVDVAVFSIGNWDAAFSKLDDFVKDVDKLVQFVKNQYHLNQTKIIYRTAQYYCCRVDTSSRARQVNGPRLQVFDQIARKRFKEELNADIWDTFSLQESKTLDEKNETFTCSSNHVPADEVEIENQIFMNGLCN